MHQSVPASPRLRGCLGSNVSTLPAQAIIAPIAAEFCGRFEAKVVKQEAPTTVLRGDELLHGGQLFWVGLD